MQRLVVCRDNPPDPQEAPAELSLDKLSYAVLDSSIRRHFGLSAREIIQVYGKGPDGVWWLTADSSLRSYAEYCTGLGDGPLPIRVLLSLQSNMPCGRACTIDELFAQVAGPLSSFMTGFGEAADMTLGSDIERWTAWSAVWGNVHRFCFFAGRRELTDRVQFLEGTLSTFVRGLLEDLRGRIVRRSHDLPGEYLRRWLAYLDCARLFFQSFRNFKDHDALVAATPLSNTHHLWLDLWREMIYVPLRPQLLVTIAGWLQADVLATIMGPTPLGTGHALGGLEKDWRLPCAGPGEWLGVGQLLRALSSTDVVATEYGTVLSAWCLAGSGTDAQAGLAATQPSAPALVRTGGSDDHAEYMVVWEGEERDMEPWVVDTYQAEIETPLLAQCRGVLATFSSLALGAAGVGGYLDTVATVLPALPAIANRGLPHASTRRKFVETGHQVFVGDHLAAIADHCHVLLQNPLGGTHDAGAQLSQLYQVVAAGCPEFLGRLADLYYSQVCRDGEGRLHALGAAVVPQDYVDTMVGLHGHYRARLACFSSSLLFERQFGAAFSRLINIPAPQPAQSPACLLAKYTDRLLDKGTRIDRQGADWEAGVSNLVCLVRYLNDMDVFFRFYGMYYARRVLGGSSAGEEYEQCVLGMFKQLLHTDLHRSTGKLERMAQDVAANQALAQNFQTHMALAPQTTAGLRPEFRAMVLCSAAWPLKESGEGFVVPVGVSECVASFLQFYSTQHSGRQLRWLHQHSRADVLFWPGRGSGRPYQLAATAYQAAVLLLFNDPTSSTHTDKRQRTTPTLSPADIAHATGLEPDTVGCVVQSLVAAGMLRTHGADELAPNGNFSSKRVKINIAKAHAQAERQSKKADEKDAEAAMEQVLRGRRMEMQATIVRIMKARHTLPHSDLVAQALEQTRRFQATLGFIKTCIGLCLESEYMERVPGAMDTYRYVA